MIDLNPYRTLKRQTSTLDAIQAHQKARDQAQAAELALKVSQDKHLIKGH